MKNKNFWVYLLEVFGITSITILGIKAIREIDNDQNENIQEEGN